MQIPLHQLQSVTSDEVRLLTEVAGSSLYSSANEELFSNHRSFPMFLATNMALVPVSGILWLSGFQFRYKVIIIQEE